MTVDWNRPIRTVGSHFPVIVLSRDWKNTAHSSKPMVAVSIKDSWGDRLFLYYQDGSPVYETERLENVPESRYLVLNNKDSTETVWNIFRTLEEARLYCNYGVNRGRGLKIYKIDLGDSIPIEWEK